MESGRAVCGMASRFGHGQNGSGGIISDDTLVGFHMFISDGIRSRDFLGSEG